MTSTPPNRRIALATLLLACAATVLTHAQNPGDYPRQDPNQRPDQRRDGDDRRDRGRDRDHDRDHDRATILNRDQAGPLMPATVFYRGQSAPIQARNSAGLRLRGDRLVLAAMVDTSGYSTGVAATYQAYLITEVPLRVGDQTLRPGAYGFGFLDAHGRGPDQMVVLDIGGNELFRTQTTRAPDLNRPTPLQILPDPTSPDSVRLFLGRSFVSLSPA